MARSPGSWRRADLPASDLARSPSGTSPSLSPRAPRQASWPASCWPEWAAYESATREPSLSTLAALVEATGVSLDLTLGGGLSGSPSSTGLIGRRLRRDRAAVPALAARSGITNLRVFGSVARGDEGPESDLDLLVHLPDGVGLFLLGRFSEELHDLLGVDVDVAPDDGLKTRVRANIDRRLTPL